MRRGRAVLLVFVCALALGAVCALVPKVFSACDFATSNIFMTLGALAFVIVVGWVLPKDEVRLPRVFRFLLRWVCPLAIAAIAVTNLL